MIAFKLNFSKFWLLSKPFQANLHDVIDVEPGGWRHSAPWPGVWGWGGGAPPLSNSDLNGCATPWTLAAWSKAGRSETLVKFCRERDVVKTSDASTRKKLQKHQHLIKATPKINATSAKVKGCFTDAFWYRFLASPKTPKDEDHLYLFGLFGESVESKMH